MMGDRLQITSNSRFENEGPEQGVNLHLCQWLDHVAPSQHTRSATGACEDVNLPNEGGMPNANETRGIDGEASSKPPKTP